MEAKNTDIMKKVVVTGPESSGKTTLFNQLIDAFKLTGVGEYAREYLECLDREYQYEDILNIAYGQLKNEDYVKSLDLDILLTDTDLLTLEIWCEYKYNKCPSFINEKLQEQLPNFYLLCYPDIPWKWDPMRENPKDRMELFEIYENKIKKMGVEYQILKRTESERLTVSKEVVQKLLDLK